MKALYLTHPQVRIDPQVPTPLWGLSEDGKQRAEAFAARRIVPAGTFVFSSRETKALDLAEILAAQAGTPVLAEHALGENDRSATGFLPPALFEETADRFFGEPDKSASGWERAVDAQRRIVEAVFSALKSVPPDTSVIFCGHGAVGTLLKCHLGQRKIARSEDQSRHGHLGGGNAFVFDVEGRALRSEWMAMEDLPDDWWR